MSNSSLLVRLRRIGTIGGLAAALALAAPLAVLADPTPPTPPQGAGGKALGKDKHLVTDPPVVPTAATLSEYWDGKADWELHAFYPKTQYAFDAGDGGYGAGTKIAVGPDGNWYWFHRTLNSPGNDCSEQPLLATSTVMRKSTDKGATWGPRSVVVAALPNTPWSCDATDGDAIWTGTKWAYLFQCRTRPSNVIMGGPFFNICLVWNDSPDPTQGTWYADAVNPVMGDGTVGTDFRQLYDPWFDICDAPEDDCVSQTGGQPGAVNQVGTPSIFTIPSEPGWFFVDIHGIDYRSQVQKGYQYTGIIKTQDFRTYLAGGGPNLPTDAIFDRADTFDWREPSPTWDTLTVGGGGGAVFHNPQDGRVYLVTESSDGGYPGACFNATAMDVGILRADSPAETTWDQPTLPGRENPIIYSQQTLLSDEPFPFRCYPGYVSLFQDPSTGETFLTLLRRSSEEDTREGVYVYKLGHNLLKNGDAWRCIETAPFHLSDPAAAPTSVQIWRDGTWATDGGCYFAFTSDIEQTFALDPARAFSSVTWGGKFAGRLTTLGPPMGYQSQPGSGTIRVDLTQLDAAGTVLSTDSLLVPVLGTYAPAGKTTPLSPGTASLRYTVSLNDTSAVLTVLADEMYVKGA